MTEATTTDQAVRAVGGLSITAMGGSLGVMFVWYLHDYRGIHTIGPEEGGAITVIVTAVVQLLVRFFGGLFAHWIEPIMNAGRDRLIRRFERKRKQNQTQGGE